MSAPEVARAADMAGRALVIKVDTERYPQLASRFNVRGIPNFVVFYGGRPVTQQVGLVDHTQMERCNRLVLPRRRKTPPQGLSSSNFLMAKVVEAHLSQTVFIATHPFAIKVRAHDELSWTPLVTSI